MLAQMERGQRLKAEPHGGTLVQRIVSADDREDVLRRAQRYVSVSVGDVALSDLWCIATGVYSPLTGFMTRADYWRVVDEMRLADGLPWTMPIALPVDGQVAARVDIGQFVRLEDKKGTTVAIMRVEDVFQRDARHEAARVFQTTDDAHPGVARLYAQPDLLLGGDIWMLDTGSGHIGRGPDGTGERLSSYVLTPAQTRAEFARRGWRRIVGFQTRNPIHRAHEYIQKCALEIVDGLLLHPLIGATKQDDVPPEVRVASYEVLVDHYYPAEKVLLAAFPAAMRYAGPREAVFHALCRKNYGCTHFIVGRDHAGVGNYYGTYDAQHIFDTFDPVQLGITPLFFEHAFFCRRCGGMATTSTCAHGPEARVTLSGTAVRTMLRAGELPPPEFTRPEVAEVLVQALVAASKDDERFS